MSGTSRLLLITLFALAVISWTIRPGKAQGEGAGGASIGPGMLPAAGLLSQVISQEGRPHTVVVTDPANAVLAVYHIDPVSGGIALKSVRNLSWDLKFTEYNSDNPSPQDVRAGLPR
jgi:hypothetical protein